MDTAPSYNCTCSIVGSEEIVAHGISISLGSHPVAEEEGGEEADKGSVDRAETVQFYVDEPTDDPEV